MAAPDATIVDLHRLPGGRLTVVAIEGEAWLLDDEPEVEAEREEQEVAEPEVEAQGEEPEAAHERGTVVTKASFTLGSTPLTVGRELVVGDTIILAAGASATVGAPLDERLSGGRRGQAHAFVDDGAFRSSPGRADVPRLLAELEEIEREVKTKLGADPLLRQGGPTSPVERAIAEEYARENLVVAEARTFPEPLARATGSILLFSCDETAFVAVAELSIPRLRALLEAYGRPVNPHLVERRVLDELFARVYPGRHLANG